VRELSISNFKKQVTVSYNGESYKVRDNGAINRQKRFGLLKRRLDDIWTFGRQCKSSGYRRISNVIVHRIVATAFYGEQPSPGHVVDHLDTNRRNNRVENLRWVTRIENLANNPRTFGRINRTWGSIQNMLNDPTRYEKQEPLKNRSWMGQPFKIDAKSSIDTDSFTPIARQRNWKTPNAFPSCPEEISARPLEAYFSKLIIESVFSHNRYGETLVQDAALSSDGNSISVVTKIIDGVKDWGLAKITFEDNKFVHEAHGTFFTIEGATKKHFEMIGKLWEGEDSIDDFC
jgi:hypothetical protein